MIHSAKAISPISEVQFKPNSERSKVLDALRAIAVLLVLGRHTSVSEVWTRIGWCGVDLFFVLSGFLISGLLFQEYKRFGDLSLKTFWLRRGLKIYPAFYVYTAALSLTYWLILNKFHGGKFPLRALWVDATFLSSYFQGLSGHTWSLAVEEHFYLLLPLFLVMLIKLGRRKDDPFTCIPLVFLGIATASLLLRMAATPANPTDHLKYLFPTHLRMDSLFCGVVLGYLFHFKPRLLARVSGWPFLFAGGALLTPICILNVENWHIYTWGLSCTYLGFAFILVWAIHLPVPRRNLLTVPLNLLARVGFYSYSIYLWHWLVVNFFRPCFRYQCITTGTPVEWSSTWETWQWPLSIVFSILLGIAMAAVVEQPMLRHRDRWFPSRTQNPAAPSINNPDSLSVGRGISTTTLYRREESGPVSEPLMEEKPRSLTIGQS
ncbi:MAG: acyltransferase [Acidobacteria bacterium]|nr:acyltransferase [Acidobacteriota bacterium]